MIQAPPGWDESSRLRAAVRDVPDFPVAGIIFKDITPILADGDLLRIAVDRFAIPFDADPPTHVVAVESRGFLFGAPLAIRWGVGVIPVRKLGKLPHETESESYALEYGTAALEIHRDALDGASRVLVVDDVLATGGTAAAAGALVRRLGATVTGYAFLLALDYLDGRQRLANAPVHAVLRFP